MRGSLLGGSETTSFDHARFEPPLDEFPGREYAESGEPLDKAGAYAIQGLASKFVRRIEGCYFNVMGLPLSLVYRYWKSLTATE